MGSFSGISLWFRNVFLRYLNEIVFAELNNSECETTHAVRVKNELTGYNNRLTTDKSISFITLHTTALWNVINDIAHTIQTTCIWTRINTSFIQASSITRTVRRHYTFRSTIRRRSVIVRKTATNGSIALLCTSGKNSTRRGNTRVNRLIIYWSWLFKG